MCNAHGRQHLCDPRDAHASHVIRLSAAFAFAALIAVVDETRATPVSPAGRHDVSNDCGDVLTAVNQFESLVRSAAAGKRPFAGPSSEQNVANDSDEGRRHAAAVTSQRPVCMKMSRSSGGFGEMVRRAIGKFKHDSGHRTSIAPSPVSGGITAPPSHRLVLLQRR
uniref:Secreted protein n=1 Tax=Schizaphis graminum TaxID=13262 RepID=A0A2S2PTD5_SCHGA